jgi:hypothetical protein
MDANKANWIRCSRLLPASVRGRTLGQPPNDVSRKRCRKAQLVGECVLLDGLRYEPGDGRLLGLRFLNRNRLCYIKFIAALAGDLLPSRAHDVVSWPETVMPVLSSQVRCEGMNGPSSVTVRGPSLTLSRPGDLDERRPAHGVKVGLSRIVSAGYHRR